jgi:hypothetical protein
MKKLSKVEGIMFPENKLEKLYGDPCSECSSSRELKDFKCTYRIRSAECLKAMCAECGSYRNKYEVRGEEAVKWLKEMSEEKL